MCYRATCPNCSKQSWRGCGLHIPQALAGVPQEEWCSCAARVNVKGGVSYPAAAALSIPGLSWVSGILAGGGGTGTGTGSGSGSGSNGGGGGGQQRKEDL